MLLALIWTAAAVLMGISLAVLYGWFPGVVAASLFLLGASAIGRIFKKDLRYFGPFTPAKLGATAIVISAAVYLFGGKERDRSKIVTPLASQTVEVSAYTDKTQIKVEREKLLYTAIIKYPKNIKIKIPDITKHPVFNGPFVMPTDSPPKLLTRNLPDGRIEKVWKITLIAVVTGPLEIPKFEVTYWKGEKKFTATIPSIAIEVGEYQNPNQLIKTLAGPKKPVLPELPLNTPQWVWWSLASLALTAGLLSLLVWLNRREYSPPPVPPEIWFEREFKRLKNRRLLEKKKFKEHYFALSEIFREYLEKRFSFPALERTTEELSLWTKNSPDLPPQTARKIRKLLQEMDRIKFAGEEPSPEEQKEHHNLIEEIVRETTPQPTDGTERAKNTS